MPAPATFARRPVRPHIGLAVRDLERAVEFYRILLGVEPSKRRPGYAKFEPAVPSLNLALNQADSVTQPDPAAHFGIEVADSAAVARRAAALEAAGLETRRQQRTACCYAVQDKVWATDPDGRPWEIFTVLEADTAERDDGSECCADESFSQCCGEDACDEPAVCGDRP